MQLKINQLCCGFFNCISFSKMKYNKIQDSVGCSYSPAFWLVERSKSGKKQPPRGVIRTPLKSHFGRHECSPVNLQIYRRAPMPKCNFNKVASNFIEITLWHECSLENLLHIFRAPFPKNNTGRLLLIVAYVVNMNLWSFNHWLKLHFRFQGHSRFFYLLSKNRQAFNRSF